MAENKPKKLLIIDGNAIVHRAYHALPPLKTKKGELVNAVYGFCLIFLKALKDLEPDFVAATFDLSGPTFRHKEFKEYKAKRVKAPDELYQQLDGVKKVLKSFGVPIFEKQGFEADDVIGTIVEQSIRKQVLPKIQNIILSGDLDALQMVSKQTKVYTMRKGIKDTVLYDTEAVKKKYRGLTPEQLTDFKALRGDPSDNIPGVTGIGEKTAIKLLKEFGTLENLYSAIISDKKSSAINQRVRALLEQYKDQAFLSRKLAEINCNVEIDFNLQDAEFKNYSPDKVADTFKDFEFHTLLNKLPNRVRTGSGHVLTLSKGIVQEIEGLEEQGVLSPKIAKLELDLIPIVEKMEENGIKIDQECLNKLSQKLQNRISKLQDRIYKLAKHTFNLNSPQQLAEVLFNKLKISTQGIRKTPGGAVSTGAPELQKIKEAHPIVKPILQYRALFKLKTGFVDSLPKMISPKDNRIHPHFHQLGAETGRMSCSKPNLQNIPIKTELGREIRKCFVSEPGYCFVSADYSQMELRVAASVAKDQKMLGFFKAGKDIHIMTAAEIFKIPEQEVNKAQRKLAKTLNYGVLYGMGPHKLSENAGISYREAQGFIQRYFANFEGIRQYVESAIAKAREKGFSETIFRRKRFLPEINSRDHRLRAQAERIARNMPMQGSSADIMKMAMLGLDKEGLLSDNCRLLLQIHDEMLFEVKKEKIKELAPKVKRIMENIVQLKVPLEVEIGSGRSWTEVENIVE